MPPVKRLLIVAVAALLAGGCAGKKNAPPPSPAVAGQAQVKTPFYLAPLGWVQKILPKSKKPPQAVPPRWLGEIKLVNESERFVLIDAVALSSALPGDELVCISEQRETARLRLSNLRSPPFLIADILGGKPSPGDRVCKQ